MGVRVWMWLWVMGCCWIWVVQATLKGCCAGRCVWGGWQPGSQAGRHHQPTDRNARYVVCISEYPSTADGISFCLFCVVEFLRSPVMCPLLSRAEPPIWYASRQTCSLFPHRLNFFFENLLVLQIRRVGHILLLVGWLCDRVVFPQLRCNKGTQSSTTS